MAKHFPTGWFTSLTGESAGTQSGVTYPAQPALNEPTTPEYDGPGAPTTRSERHQLRRQPRRQPRRPDLRSGPRPEPPGQRGPGVQLDHARTTAATPTTRPARATTSPGAFNANGTPNYTPAGLPAYDPEATTPLNYTGGLYAADLFLRYYIPLIEQSAAFADGGLIDITFDEANPPFTDRQQLQQRAGPRRQHDLLALRPTSRPSARPGPRHRVPNSLYGAYGVLADAAGENINGAQREHRADRSERPRGDQQLG